MAVLTRTSNIDLVDLPDCCALREDGKCKWLNVAKCLGADCSYQKEAASQEKTFNRLRSLDEKTQQHIANKYYGGLRPWQNNENPS